MEASQAVAEYLQQVKYTAEMVSTGLEAATQIVETYETDWGYIPGGAGPRFREAMSAAFVGGKTSRHWEDVERMIWHDFTSRRDCLDESTRKALDACTANQPFGYPDQQLSNYRFSVPIAQSRLHQTD